MPAEAAPAPKLAMASMKDASIYQKSPKTRSPPFAYFEIIIITATAAIDAEAMGRIDLPV